MVRRTRQSRRGKGVVVLPLLSVGWALWDGREVEACKDGLLMQTATFLLVLDFRLLLLRLLLVPSGVVITSSSLIQLLILLLLLLPPLMLPRLLLLLLVVTNTLYRNPPKPTTIAIVTKALVGKEAVRCAA